MNFAMWKLIVDSWSKR